MRLNRYSILMYNKKENSGEKDKYVPSGYKGLTLNNT